MDLVCRFLTEEFQVTSSSSGLSSTETETLRLVGRVLSSFSIFGALVVILLFIFLKKVRSFALELVAWLCICEVMFSTTVYFPVYESDNEDSYYKGSLSFSCKSQSLINITFDISALIWTTIIGYTALKSITSQENLDRNQKRFRIIFILIAFIYPIVFSVIVLFAGANGPSGVFCWMATVSGSNVVYTLTLVYYATTWLIISFNCFCVCQLIRLLRNELRNEEEVINNYTSKLQWYPTIQIISYIPCTCNRVFELVSGKHSFTLLMMQMICDSLTGLAFAVVYGFNGDVRRAVVLFIRTAIFCGNQRESRCENTKETVEQDSLSKKESLTSIEDNDWVKKEEQEVWK